MKRVMLVFGTRPEAIKMCPLVNELKKRKNFEVLVCATGQHRQMLDGVLSSFGVKPDYSLSLMRENQSLFDITSGAMDGMREVLTLAKPEALLVHGDTSTAFSAALAAFYLGISVFHVEAGLRTYDIKKPFPEEFNRRAISLVADLNFAPTERAKENLMKEGICETKIYVTGNTVTDALRTTVRTDYTHPQLVWARGARLVLVTAHRRESIGEKMRGMLRAIKRVVEETPDLKAIYPVHMNPRVREIANEELCGCERIRLIEPLDMLDFHNFLAHSYLVLTDSGGIQEEAPTLGIPVLVMRDTTERPEGIRAGSAILVGTEEEGIYSAFKGILSDESLYKRMATVRSPYGDGFVSQRITDIIENNI